LNRGAFRETDERVPAGRLRCVALENANLYQQAQQEISNRRRVEEALLKAEERYALAVIGNDGQDWDIPANRVYYAPRWTAMIGYEEYEIGDSPEEWFQRVHPEDVMQVKSKIAAHLKGTTAHFQAEYRLLHRDGAYRWELCRGLAVWDVNGAAYRFAGSQTDIMIAKGAKISAIRILRRFDRLAQPGIVCGSPALCPRTG
jgi:PAS domain-containing protein